MTWLRRSDTYYELESRGNIEGMVKRIVGGWTGFLDATDMVNVEVVCIDVADLKDAKSATQKRLTEWRRREKYVKKTPKRVSQG